MARPYEYDPEKLETVLYAKGQNFWEWSVCEKSKGPLESGTVSGSRAEAQYAASKAMSHLIDKAPKKRR